MKVTPRMMVAAAALTCMGAIALADGTSSKGQNSGKQAAKQTEAPSVLSQFVGEWEGTVEVRWNEKETSASVASVSSKVSNDGCLVSCFEGFARGEHFEGSMRLKVDAASSKASSVSYDSRTGSTTKGEGTTGDVQSVVITTGEAQHPILKKKVTMRQTARMVSKNECVIEWASIDSEGKESPAMKLTLTRMSEGQVSAANALFQDTKLLSKVDSAQLIQTANATEGE